MLDEEYDLANVLTAERFSLEVERRHLELDGESTLLEIAAEYLEQLGIGAENGAPLISQPLFEKLQAEAMSRHLLKVTSTAFPLF